MKRWKGSSPEWSQDRKKKKNLVIVISVFKCRRVKTGTLRFLWDIHEQSGGVSKRFSRRSFSSLLCVISFLAAAGGFGSSVQQPIGPSLFWWVAFSLRVSISCCCCWFRFSALVARSQTWNATRFPLRSQREGWKKDWASFSVWNNKRQNNWKTDTKQKVKMLVSGTGSSRLATK